MKHVALITFASTLALSHLAVAQDGQEPIVRRPPPHAAVNRENPRPGLAGEGARNLPNAQRPLPGHVQQFRQNAGGLPAAINGSPRYRTGDLTPRVRTQPSVTPAPLGATTPQQQPASATRFGNTSRDWRNGNGTAGQDWRTRTGGNNQAANNDNWRNRNGGGQHHEWHHDWDRNHHDRDWWRHHYTRFALFGGGYYYWDAGFWYPAYGYDPFYSTYVYEAPIYGYNSLPPGEVMAAVQEELARRGYYYGAIDGTYGPLTREALLRYQQSVGLAMSGLLDQPTLESLGID